MVVTHLNPSVFEKETAGDIHDLLFHLAKLDHANLEGDVVDVTSEAASLLACAKLIHDRGMKKLGLV